MAGVLRKEYVNPNLLAFWLVWQIYWKFFASVRFLVQSWLATASLGYPIGHISFPAGYGLPPGNQHLWMVFPLKSTFLMDNSQLAMVSSTDKWPSALWLSTCLPLLVLQTCLLVVVQATLTTCNQAAQSQLPGLASYRSPGMPFRCTSCFRTRPLRAMGFERTTEAFADLPPVQWIASRLLQGLQGLAGCSWTFNSKRHLEFPPYCPHGKKTTPCHCPIMFDYQRETPCNEKHDKGCIPNASVSGKQRLDILRNKSRMWTPVGLSWFVKPIYNK